METEIWPALINSCHRKNIPVVITNGRISDKSFPGYRRIRYFIGKTLAKISLLLMQTQTDRERMIALGAPAGKVQVVGNLKYEAALPEGIGSNNRDQIRTALGLDNDDLVIIGGSTFAGEEAILLELFVKLKADHPTLHLILAPRHPERFAEVGKLMAETGLTWQRISELQANQKADLYLLDVMGQLADYYAAAELAFIGKSLCGGGGQNPLEPAAKGVPVLFGPDMGNFKQITEQLLADGAARQVKNETELQAALHELLAQPDLRNQMSAAAKTTIKAQTGVADNIIMRLNKLL